MREVPHFIWSSIIKKKVKNFSSEKSYILFLGDIISEIRNSQYEALKVVNQHLLQLYWSIGKKITYIQKKEKWNAKVVEFLSLDLKKEFPGIRGFSSKNLWKMRQFYSAYIDNERLHQLVTQISWTHNITVINKCKDYLEQEFYIRMVIKYGWTHNVLAHHIENNTYQKTIANQTNFTKTLPKSIQDQAKLAFKDEYIFDFLELGEEHTENELEKCLVQNIESFLNEIGDMFTFVKSQYRVEIDGNEYFIDILLFHRRLRCLIAIELKIGKFLPEHVGKMQFYLAILDDKVRLQEEKPSIGIIICKSKDKTVVEYALKNTNKPIGIASYSISSFPPKELEQELPNPTQILKLLEKLSIKEKQILNSQNLLSLEDKTNMVLSTQKKIIQYLKKHGTVTNKECQIICKVKKKQATNLLSELLSQDILLRRGAGRSTHYILKETR